ncbi:hypothetical protein GCM10022214_76770 [Actinomadura miaoliensis]|uniref:DUF397 domain-containing protein n=1 Tax=Actinomadura miaoliensis TaxID=430685 RepID=A0ABP7WYU9_9ACTN
MGLRVAVAEGSRESPPRPHWGVRAPSPVPLRHLAISPSDPGSQLPTNTYRPPGVWVSVPTSQNPGKGARDSARF